MGSDLRFTRILERFERALRNNERLHLDVDQVRALATSPVYSALTVLHVDELREAWAADEDVSSSDPLSAAGRPPQPTSTTATPAEKMPQAVIDAEWAQVASVAKKTAIRGKLRRRSARAQPIKRIE